MKKIILIFLILTLTMSSFFPLNVFAASDKTNAKNARTISLNKKKTDTTTISGKYYKFDIKQPGKLTLKLDFEDGNIPAMVLYDFDGDTFDKIASASASSGWVGFNEEDPIYIENLRLSTGTYYVKVYWGAGTAFFVDDLEHYLTIIFEAEGAEYEKENNNKASNANIFTNKIVGNIGTSSDVDFYTFTPTSNANIKVRFSLDGSSGGIWRTTLYELNGSELKKLDYISVGWMNSKDKLKEDLYTGRYYAQSNSVSIYSGKKYYVYVECDNGWYHSDKDYTIEVIDESGNLINNYGEQKTTTENINKITVYLNGELLVFDQEPIIIDGRTLVPVRTIAEALGSFVDWDEKTQTAIIQRGLETVVFQIGNDKAYSREIRNLDVSAQIINNRTLIPLRALSEIFGADVSWNEDTKEINITCQVYNDSNIFNDFKRNGFLRFNYFSDSFIDEHLNGGWLNKYAWANAISNVKSWGTRIFTGQIGDFEKDLYKDNLKTILTNITNEKTTTISDSSETKILKNVGKGAEVTAEQLKKYFEKEFPGNALELSNWGEANAAKFMKYFSEGMDKVNKGIKYVSFPVDIWSHILTDYTNNMHYLESIKFAVADSKDKELNKAIDELEKEYSTWYAKALYDTRDQILDKIAEKGIEASLLWLSDSGSSVNTLYGLSTFVLEQGAKLTGAKKYSDNVDDAIALIGIDNNLKFYNKDMLELNYDFVTDTMRDSATENTWAALVDSFKTTKACTIEAYNCMLAVTDSEIEKIYLSRQIEIMKSIMISEEKPQSAEKMFYSKS